MLRILHFLFLAAVLLVVSCGGEESSGRAPSPAEAQAGATPHEAQADAPVQAESAKTPSAARGGEGSGENGAPAASRTRTSILTAADTGDEGFEIPFRVRPDGFSFRNYGAGYPEGDFTILELREQFGDGVCSRIEGDKCIPTARAQQWIADRNADMKSGHCIGFTVASYRFLEGALQPAAYAPDAAVTFDIDQQVEIMRDIAAAGSLYWVKSVWSSEVSGTPREVLEALIELGQPVDLSIFLPGLAGGHSLLAYGVEQVAPQRYHILVYDNNFPGEEAYVEVDYEANTWRYDQGAVNPGVEAIPYEGDAQTETLRFIPLSAYDEVACPFCDEESGEQEGGGLTLLSFLGRGDVLVETESGAIGMVEGEIINEIPGAYLLPQRGQLSADDAPEIILPPGAGDYTVRFSSLQRVSSMSPDFAAVLNELAPTPEESILQVRVDDKSIAYQAGGEQSPALKTTVSVEDASVSIALLGVEMADGQGLFIGEAPGGEGLELRSQEADVSEATLLVTRLTDESEAVFISTSVDIQKDRAVALDVAAWDGGDSIDLYRDGNGDGLYVDPPTELVNEPLANALQKSDVDKAGGIINELGPYLGEQGLASILDALPRQNLTGQAIGQILLPLQLPNEQLIELIPTLSLPMRELAELFFALRLPPERQEAIIEALELGEEEESALRGYLADLALFREILVAWDYRNSDDPADLAALLNERTLTVEQIVNFLPRTGLSKEELGAAVVALDLSDEDRAMIAELLELEIGPPGSRTPTPTRRPATPTPSATPTISGTMPLTQTLTMTATPTLGAVGTSPESADPDGNLDPPPNGYPGPSADGYPGSPPEGYPGPGGYPGQGGYPGPVAQEADPQNGYPGPAPATPMATKPNPTATPAYLSYASCADDDLQVTAREPGWINATINVLSDRGLLFSGSTGPSGEAFVSVSAGPGTWTNLRIESSLPPSVVRLGTISCP